MHRFEGADRMTHEQVPDGDAELAGDGDTRFVAAAAGGDREGPLLQRIIDSLGTLTETWLLHCIARVPAGLLRLPPWSGLASHSIEENWRLRSRLSSSTTFRSMT